MIMYNYNVHNRNDKIEQRDKERQLLLSQSWYSDKFWEQYRKVQYCYRNIDNTIIISHFRSTDINLSAEGLSFPEFGELQFALTPAPSGVMSQGLCSKNIT